MKKFTLSTLLLLFSSSCFASRESDFYDMTMTYYWISVIVAIFAICLFCKLWTMTNNVKEIKNSLLAGKVDEEIDLERRYLKQFIYSINTEFNKKARVWDSVKSIYIDNSALILDSSIKGHIDKLQSKYNKIGESVPDYILNMKTFRDFFEVYGI